MNAVFVVVALVATSVFGLILPDSPQYQIVLDSNRRPQCPEAEPSKLFQLFNPDTESYLYTTSFEAIHGYEFDVVAARVFDDVQPSTVPLYHVLLLNKDTQSTGSFYTRDPHERDFALLSSGSESSSYSTVYVFPRRICGSKPFFRLYNLRSRNFFYTADQNEVDRMMFDEGYEEKGIVGFVMLDK
ncbi:hypothetical protein C8F01DRAFT_1105755 [Mycena amicta]|nr:hypothetical protein C8F01DRAFT_1105755 [Mycena amicta]